MAASLTSTLAEDLRPLHQDCQLRPPSATDLSALTWETRQSAFLALFSKVSGAGDAALQLQELITKRRDVRRAFKEQERSSRAEDVGLLPEQARREEDEHRRQVIEVVVAELRRQNAPRGLSNARLLLKDKAACLQALDFLMARHKSHEKASKAMLTRLTTSQHPSAAAASCSFSSSFSTTTTQTSRRPPSRGRRPLSSRDGSSSLSMQNRPAWVSPLGDSSFDLHHQHHSLSSEELPSTPPPTSSTRRRASVPAASRAESSPPRARAADDGADEEGGEEEDDDDDDEAPLASSGEYVAGSGVMQMMTTATARRRASRRRSSSSLTTSGGLSSPGRGASGGGGEPSGFYCSQLLSLEEQVRALRAENAGLRRKLEQAETLHEAMVGRQAGGRGSAGCDERRVAVLQAQHLQLRRQVKSLQAALDGQRELGVHLSSLLTALDDNVAAILRIGQQQGTTGTGKAQQEQEKVEDDDHRPAAAAAAAPSSSSKPPQVGPRFWSSVQEQVVQLSERWKAVQRQSKAAQAAALLLPRDAQAFLLRKPSQLGGSPAAAAPSSSSLRHEEETAGEAGDLKELDAEKVMQLERGIRDMVGSLDRLQADLQATGYGGVLERSMQQARDCARALLLDVGYLGLVVPVPPTPRGDAKERQVVQGLRALTVKGLKPAELARQAQQLEQLVLAERRALALALSSSTEELVTLRSGVKRHLELLCKLAEGMKASWSAHQADLSTSAPALEAVLQAFGAVCDSQEVQRLTRGHAGEGLAELMRTLAAYQGDLHSMLECCERSRTDQRTSRLVRLWERYDQQLDELMTATSSAKGQDT